ncbi:MAG: amidohydrolase [Candidatus Izemoplasmatales bacterium]|jgi:imidazolonepropionase-like amidohydrolase|nr:amidohydrolase [Candidatus Izemoplasmatales bacterium]
MYLIKNANLISMADINYEMTDILVEGKTIKQIGKLNEKDFKNVKVIDASGMYVTPGVVDPHCHIGIFEEAIGFEGADGNEMTSPITPELRAIDAIKPQDVAFEEAMQSGVTTVCTGPGSANCIGGTFTVLKTYGKTVDDMVVVKESSMKMALGENPKRVYNSKSQSPATRMATAALIREALQKAKDYQDKLDEYEENHKNNKEAKKPEYNMKWASLARVFKGFPVKIHAHQQDDIVTAIRIIEEFGLNATIEHATEGHLIPEYLKAHNQRVIIGPTLGSKSKYELRNKSFDSAKILHENGVEFAIMTDHPVIHLANALTQVGIFVREGLSELEGLKAVTINAAKINHVEDRVGSIEVGKDADIVIWDGHPLHYLTKTKMVMINGEITHKK